MLGLVLELGLVSGCVCYLKKKFVVVLVDRCSVAIC